MLRHSYAAHLLVSRLELGKIVIPFDKLNMNHNKEKK
jgi:hypothetical protein